MNTVADPRAFSRFRNALRKYSALAHIAARQSLEERAALVGRMGFYLVLLLVFSKLWEAVLEPEAAAGGARSAEYLWYLAVTEWIMLSQPPLYLDIEAEVRSGDVAYRVTRPVSYLGAKLAEGAGSMLLRMASLGVFGFGVAWFLTGSLPPSPVGLLLALPLAVLASLTSLLFYAAIGISAFWLQDCSPTFWIWQKLSFVLGGLILPLSIYPAWLQEIALLSPFSAILHGPGRMVATADVDAALSLFLRLSFWSVLAFALGFLLFRRGVRRLEINGG